MRFRGGDSFGWWAYTLLLAGVALIFDAADRRVPFSVVASGPLDEVAHFATAALGLLVLECFVDIPRRFYVAALVASVAIDLDHIPLYLGLLGNQDQRPVTHSLATVIVFVVAAVASRGHRAMLAGASIGLVLHFARDIAEGPPGVRMLWPLQQTAWSASYWWFLGMIIAFTVARLILVAARIPRTRVRLFESLTGISPASARFGQASRAADRLRRAEPVRGVRHPIYAIATRRYWRHQPAFADLGVSTGHMVPLSKVPAPSVSQRGGEDAQVAAHRRAAGRRDR